MSFEAANADSVGVDREQRKTALLGFVIDAIGYGLASAAALGVDYGLLVLLVGRFGMHYLVAASLSFSAGLVVAYTLSTTFVFKGRAKYSAGGELLGFVLTGLAGLALNQLLLYAFVDGVHIPVQFAKAPTACLVFTFNFLTRRTMLFSAERRQAR
ncbi:MAG: GtrA family protein [Hyphomicrobiales bacterium]|nr:GtrA family protein [Hyphomicrobiales bacterium]